MKSSTDYRNQFVYKHEDNKPEKVLSCPVGFPLPGRMVKQFSWRLTAKILGDYGARRKERAAKDGDTWVVLKPTTDTRIPVN